ncbi:hypothetical protein VN97_g12839, partial [Penicillium thymicola]
MYDKTRILHLYTCTEYTCTLVHLSIGCYTQIGRPASSWRCSTSSAANCRQITPAW